MVDASAKVIADMGAAVLATEITSVFGRRTRIRALSKRLGNLEFLFYRVNLLVVLLLRAAA